MRPTDRTPKYIFAPLKPQIFRLLYEFITGPFPPIMTADTAPVTAEGRKAWFLEHDPHAHPIFVAEVKGQLVGWCSLSIYLPGRMALRFTAEISFYADNAFHRRGIGSAIFRHALQACPSLGIKNVVAVLIDRNESSRKILEKMGFQQWGCLLRVLDFDGKEYGEFYDGK